MSNPTLINPKDAIWVNEEKTILDVTLMHSVHGAIPFTADKNSTEQHVRDVFEMVINTPGLTIADYDRWRLDPSNPENPANQIPVVKA